MYIFADSGATKTGWLITDKNGNILKKFKTVGLNPYFWKAKDIYKTIRDAYPEGESELNIEKVFFYGAGCDNHEKHVSIYDALESFFPVAIIYIYTDILGAARALFKDKEGIAGILGTGSNSCVYNGNTIYRKAISLGYVLGDEGSGAHIGKLFIKNYLENNFDEALTETIKIQTEISISDVLEAVYSNPHPNRYLASLCSIVKNHIDNPQVRNIVKESFSSFFTKYIKIFSEHTYMPLSFCGSVAHHFEPILTEVARENDIKISNIIQEPLLEIIEYHKHKDFY